MDNIMQYMFAFKLKYSFKIWWLNKLEQKIKEILNLVREMRSIKLVNTVRVSVLSSSRFLFLSDSLPDPIQLQFEK